MRKTTDLKYQNELDKVVSAALVCFDRNRNLIEVGADVNVSTAPDISFVLIKKYRFWGSLCSKKDRLFRKYML